ncbi:type III restriction endonuclease subunit M [Mesomycoplasma neurolyticum]|uniref:C-terminal truncated Type III restriction-modification system: methylase n=1 Tax=Mesomycoplasma neurolyticum TaxID=2120 RepID=A0A449A5B0_9BACT|nr:type III restriction endonuclease subunit M [Mesomycoplasma neurolyticum]VEU59417.1 C-terminal truncated Type III restriction-modification system: methylase [Mesomycoplasma neurolyticum]
MSKYQEYIEKLKKLENDNGIKYINNDQKELISQVLEKFKDDDFSLEQVYKLLIQRIKLGFRFDAAPEPNHEQISLLAKNKKLSLNEDVLEQRKNHLIIGENYDALKNLLVLERERERERPRIII